MKKLLLYGIVSLLCISINAQNVGIGTPTPAEKLDVNGNINLSGALKINGDGGSANQALMKDASNNLVWGNLSEYKNVIQFDCNNPTSTPGAGNCSATWLVPAGVTEILVECWGGGGGGATMSGGAGGGYISAKLTVVPGTTATLTIGAGGGNSLSLAGSGILGGTSSLVCGGPTISATGGSGGIGGDPFTTGSASNIPQGGIYSTTATSQYVGYNGGSPTLSKLSFQQVNATDYAKIVDYGNGGDAALMPGSGSLGGYKISSTSVNQTLFTSHFAAQQGGGGGADASFGFDGRGGRIIIHW